MRHIIATSVLVVTLFVWCAECDGEAQEAEKLGESVLQKDATIAECALNVTSLTVQLEENARVIEQKERIIDVMGKTITSLESKVSEKSSTVSSQQGQLSADKYRIRRLTADIAQLRSRMDHRRTAAVLTAIVVICIGFCLSLRGTIKARDATIAQLKKKEAPAADAAVAHPQAAVSTVTAPLHDTDPDNADVVLVSLPPSG